MQLSLPPSLPVSPDVAVAGSATPAAGHCGQGPADQADVSFDSLLPEAAPVDDPATAKVGDEAAEAAASLLAGAFWMAVGPLPLATAPAAGAVDVAVGGTTTPAGEPGDDPVPASGRDTTGSPSLFAPRSSRAFAAIATAAARFESKLVPGNGPGHVLVAATGADALTDAPAPGAAALANSQAGKSAVAPGSIAADAELPAVLNVAGVPANPVAGAAIEPKAATTPAADEDGIEKATAEISPAGIRRLLRAPAATLAGDRPVLGSKAITPENIAAAARYPDASPSAKNLPEKKEFLNPDQVAVTARRAGVGISVAQQAAAMSPNPSTRSKSALTAELAPVVSVAVDKSPAPNLASEAAAPVKTVRETLAAVVSAVDALERKAGAGPKSVDLQFRVGDESLALRVELRDGTVHTTFRAQSAELRTALAQEWQTIVQPVAGREIRIADPVFNTSASGDAAFGSTGQGTPHQRGQASPENTPFSFTREFAGAAGEAPATAPATVAPGSASLLNTFA